MQKEVNKTKKYKKIELFFFPLHASVFFTLQHYQFRLFIAAQCPPLLQRRPQSAHCSTLSLSVSLPQPRSSLSLTHSLSRLPAAALSPSRWELTGRRSLSRSPASTLYSLPLSGLSPSLCSSLSLSAICRFQ